MHIITAKGLHRITVSLYPGDNSPRIRISHSYFICGKNIPRIGIEVWKLPLSLRISFSSGKKKFENFFHVFGGELLGSRAKMVVDEGALDLFACHLISSSSIIRY